MPPLESLTITQLAALCGLKRAYVGGWASTNPTGPRRLVSQSLATGLWMVWPNGIEQPASFGSSSERSSLLMLARHLNLTPKEDTVKYRRIDRDPKTDEYVDYTPKAGDRWHFGRGEPWTVDVNGRQIGPPMAPFSHGATCHILALTTHIERTIAVRDVKGPDYAPEVGDVLCGPDGPLFVVSTILGGLPGVTPVGDDAPIVGLAVAHFALCTRIEREE